MILAAGIGKRLRPLTLTVPKPLIELNGIPLLQRAIDRVVAASLYSPRSPFEHLDFRFGRALIVPEGSINTVVINTHYLGEQIEHYVRGLDPIGKGIRLILSPEPELLETGGGIAFARKHFKEGPLITLNSDIWWESEEDIFSQLCAHWDESKMDALLVVIPHERALFFKGAGDFEKTSDGQLIPRNQRCSRAQYIYTGIQMIAPDRLLNNRSGHFPLAPCYADAFQSKRLYGIELQGYWSDVGTLDALQDLEKFLKKSE
jgi:MurNAc alpha-1-phosphate uridylyltransferase